MAQPEVIIILVNLAIVLSAYCYIYPKFAGKNLNKVSVYDLVLSLLSVLIAGTLFWGQGIEFNAIVFELNWFWFSILTYLLLELPLLFWYYKKQGVHPFRK